ncbi:MAG: PilZ domain-containing protein [Nitrospirota bacterium]
MRGNHHNQRNFFRVDAYIPFTHRRIPSGEPAVRTAAVLSPEEALLLQDIAVKKVNISGGGLAFDSQRPYNPGDRIEIAMVLKVRDGALVVCGEVVRTDQVRGLYRVAVRYLDMDEKIRGIITKFVFLRERELRDEKRAGWL